MTGNYIAKIALLLLGTGAVLADACGASMVLRTPGKSDSHFFINTIDKLANGHLCIVGDESDIDKAETRAKIIVVNMVKQQIVWQKTLDRDNSRFAACRSDGTFFYVGANVESSSSPSQSRVMSIVFKFDAQGKLVAEKDVDTGTKRAVLFDIELDSGAVTAVGMASNWGEEAESNAMYFGRLDLGLKTVAVTKLATGAFDSDAAVRLSNNTALLAGVFRPFKISDATPVNDYAVSLIGANRKYQFSVRPHEKTLKDITGAISATGEVVSIGYTPENATWLSVVGADGKLKDKAQIKSSLCETKSLGVDGEAIYAIRKKCNDDSGVAKLVAIDRKNRVETVVGGVDGVPLHVFPIAGTVYVVSEKGRGRLILQTIAPDNQAK